MKNLKKMLTLSLLFLSVNTFAQNYKISREKAIEIATKNTNKGQLKSIEIERSLGRLVWDIEIWDNEATKEFKIDVNSGKIVKSSVDYDDFDENPVKNNTSKNNNKKILTEAQIVNIIKKDNSRVTVREISLKTKYGRTLFEVEVYLGRDDFEYIIDAYTGEILGIDY